MTKIIAPIDEKNVTTDWIEYVFDGADCVRRENMFTGFVKGSACSCVYYKNRIFWEVHHNFCKDAIASYDELIRRLKECDKDTETLIIEYNESMRENLILGQAFYWKED